MKILLAYDGSRSANAALLELRRAGLPERTRALVVSIASLWLPFLAVPGAGEKSPAGRFDAAALEAYTAAFDARVGDARATAILASDRLRAAFPKWKLTAAGSCGTPATEILQFANVWRPDLIVVGSHNRSAIGRLLLGSVSRRIAVEARCSVRIGREKDSEAEDPVRILVGVDGSRESTRAVRAVAKRRWPEGSAFHVVTAVGSRFELGVEAAATTALDMRRAQAAQRRAEAILRSAEVDVTSAILEEEPTDALLREAEAWGADAIFVGCRGLGRVDRFLLGSVSLAVATRATCSVEIVRDARRTEDIHSRAAGDARNSARRGHPPTPREARDYGAACHQPAGPE